MRRLARAPMTTALLLAAGALQGMVWADRAEGESLNAALSRWGAVVPQAWPGEPELTGLFRLWSGQRSVRSKALSIGASTLHHSGIAPLLLSCAVFGFVGLRVEPRWGSLRFLLLTALLSLAGFGVAWMVQETPLGLFTATCGLVFAAGRRGSARHATDGAADDGAAPHEDAGAYHDRAMARWVLPLTVGAVLVVVVATVSGYGHGPYVAWLTAMGCGWRLGAGLPPQDGDRRLLSAFRLMPCLVALSVWGATHPVWFGTYHWSRALETPDPRSREARLRRAVKADPYLAGPHLALAKSLAARRELHAAWRVALEGLKHHARDARMTDTARGVWNAFQTDGDRVVARQTLSELFPVESPFWEKHLGLVAEANQASAAPQPESHAGEPRGKASPEREFPLDQSIELPKSLDDGPERPPRNLRLPPPDPAAPDNAAEGRRT